MLCANRSSFFYRDRNHLWSSLLEWAPDSPSNQAKVGWNVWIWISWKLKQNRDNGERKESHGSRQPLELGCIRKVEKPLQKPSRFNGGRNNQPRLKFVYCAPLHRALSFLPERGNETTDDRCSDGANVEKGLRCRNSAIARPVISCIRESKLSIRLWGWNGWWFI